MTRNIDTLTSLSTLSSAKDVSPVIHIGVSLDALLDFSNAYHIHNSEGEKAYLKHMRQNAHKPMNPGRAFPFVAKMLTFNGSKAGHVRLSILSCSTITTITRAKHSLEHHGLIGPYAYPLQTNVAIDSRCDAYKQAIADRNIDFFLSTNPKEVEELLDSGFSAGLIENGSALDEQFDNHNAVVISSDFDRVMGVAYGMPGDELEHLDEVAYSKRFGYEAVWQREQQCVNIPAKEGPALHFVKKLFALRDIVNNNNRQYDLSLPIVTARTGKSLGRVKTTLREWGLAVDGIYSTGDNCKGDILKNLRTDLFMDDSDHHIRQAREKSQRTLAVHIPWVRSKSPISLNNH